VARTKAGLGPEIRLTDFISLGVLGRFIPVELVRSVLARLGRQSIRQRDLPAEALVYYIVALGFYAGVSCDEVLRCLSEGIEWVMGQGARIRLAGKSAISQGRRRLGSSVMEELFQLVARPLAIADSQEPTLGAWYRQWQVVSLDGTTLEVANTEANRLYFGRPGASHLIFSTKDRCPFLGKSDLLQPAHAYLGGILRRVQCPTITLPAKPSIIERSVSKTNFEKSCASTRLPSMSVTYGINASPRICRAFSAALLLGNLPRPRKLSLG
jgi:hypothetical protein